jgi:lipopolysaccharide transport system permease protein
VRSPAANIAVSTEVGRSPGQPGGRAASSRVLAANAGLIWTLVRTDFKVRYHGTLGGFVWAMLKPLTMFVLLMSVFSFIFGAEPNYRLNLIIGLFLYDFFTESTKVGLVSLHTRGFLLTRARCPAWILVVTSLSNPLITLTVFSVALVVFLVASGHGVFIVGIVAYASYVLAFTGIVTAFSLASSVLFLRYRDLNQVWEVASQAGFFLAPIIYPLGMLPERFHIWLYLWAPTPIVEFSRAALVQGVLPSPRAHVYLAVATALALAVGTAIFRRLSPRAAEFV